jgi:hypothetical protein
MAGHGPMPEQTVLVLMAGVAQALADMHAAGVVHRDLKPSNVLLAPDGPRVTDSVITRAADTITLTHGSVQVGSMQFMAPEQVSGQPVSPAVDVFMLGSVAAFAALRRPPFGEDNPVRVLYRLLNQEADLSGCPPRLREVIERCLTKDAAARPLPADIISLCRARMTGQTGQARPWLPPAVAAALAAHVPPPPATSGFPSTVTVSPSPGAVSGAFSSGATVPPPRRRLRVPLPVMAGGGLAVFGTAALIAATVLVLGNHGGSAPAAKHGLAAAPARHTTAPRSASPSPSTTLDSCLIGSWKATSDNLINKIYGESVEFTGKGATLVVRADGSSVTDWTGMVLSANVNGNSWTDVFKGSASVHLETADGFILQSDVTPSKGAEWTLKENGAYSNSGPLSAEPGPERYTCAGNSLREFADNGSDEYVRTNPLLAAARPVWPTRFPTTDRELA